MKNPPISYNPIMGAVMLRNGTLVPVKKFRAAHPNTEVFTPRSKKEARKWAKTRKIVRKRMAKDPLAVVDYFMREKRR